MPRTTVDLDEDLLRILKEKAARDGRTLQDVTNELLRQAVALQKAARSYRLRLRGWKARLQPGIDLFDRDSLSEAMEGRR